MWPLPKKCVIRSVAAKFDVTPIFEDSCPVISNICNIDSTYVESILHVTIFISWNMAITQTSIHSNRLLKARTIEYMSFSWPPTTTT
jgi:hypothetical protein